MAPLPLLRRARGFRRGERGRSPFIAVVSTGSKRTYVLLERAAACDREFAAKFPTAVVFPWYAANEEVRVLVRSGTF